MRMLYEGMQTGAITVPKGIFAVVDFEKCTGAVFVQENARLLLLKLLTGITNRW